MSKKFAKKFGKRANLPGRVPTPATYTNVNATKVEVEGMPVEVATALLSEPRAKLTNTMRKACWAARSNYYLSTLTPKTPEETMPPRLARSTWLQVTKWSRRVTRRLLSIGYAEKKIKGMGEQAQKERQFLMLKEAALERAAGLIADEIQRRSFPPNAKLALAS